MASTVTTIPYEKITCVNSNSHVWKIYACEIQFSHMCVKLAKFTHVKIFTLCEFSFFSHNVKIFTLCEIVCKYFWLFFIYNADYFKYSPILTTIAYLPEWNLRSSFTWMSGVRLRQAFAIEQIKKPNPSLGNFFALLRSPHKENWPNLSMHKNFWIINPQLLLLLNEIKWIYHKTYENWISFYFFIAD